MPAGVFQKRFCIILLVFMLLIASAAADPLPLLEDLSETIVRPYDENDPSAGQYSFSCLFPHADPNAVGANLVNKFYETKLNEMLDFYIDHDFDYYQGEMQDYTVKYDFVVTCNNSEFFSVLVRKKETVGGEVSESWEGNTFSRVDGFLGSVSSLPVLLGLLEAGGSGDTWLEDRQTRKVSEAVWTLILDMMKKNPDGVPFYQDLTEEDLELMINPELDFFLDETGNPVFFIFPGYAADASEGFLTFSVPMSAIEDEL